jgi:hypothetical protein
MLLLEPLTGLEAFFVERFFNGWVFPQVKNEPAEDYSEVEFVEVSPADEQRPVHLDSKEEPNNVELPRSESWDVAQEDVTAVLQVEHTFT